MKSDGHKKAWFITKGFTQVFGIDYENTFSPVTQFETLWLLLSLAVIYDWELEALDVKTAFLFGELEEEIYMDQPKDFVVKARSLRSVTYEKPSMAWNKLCFNGTSSSTRVSWRWVSPVHFQTQEPTSGLSVKTLSSF